LNARLSEGIEIAKICNCVASLTADGAFVLLCSTYWKAEEDVSIAGLGGEVEAYPYVYFTINIT